MDKSKGRWGGSPQQEFIEDDGLDYEIDYMADVDDQRAHHFKYYGIKKWITNHKETINTSIMKKKF